MEKAPEEEIVNYCTFNQEQTCIAVGTNNGFKVLAVNPFTLLYSFEGAAVSIVEMLYSTNIIAVVGMNERAVFTPRRLTVWDTNSQTSRIDFSFNSPITYVRMNKQRLIVATQYNIDVYNLLNMHRLFSIDIDGSLIRLALTPGLANCYLAYTASIVKGDITVYDLITCTKQVSITAHKRPVIQMKFNQKGNLLATASSDGKTIRVFSVPSGNKLYSLKRGIHMTEIYSMSFDPTSTFFGLTSVRGTLHIFRLGEGTTKVQNETKTALYREMDSEEEMPNNYKKDNKNDFEEDGVEEETKGSEGGCCGGWLGLKFVLNKLGSIVVEDPVETFTAVKFTAENIKKQNILALDKENKAILFCKDGSYYEYTFDPDKNEVKEATATNLVDLKVTSE